MVLRDGKRGQRYGNESQGVIKNCKNEIIMILLICIPNSY